MRQYPKFWVAQVLPAPEPKEKDLEQQKKVEEKEGSEEESAHDTLSELERGPL
jgi:ribosomal protein L12E/L44/L45/RPP1/RPP2